MLQGERRSTVLGFDITPDIIGEGSYGRVYLGVKGNGQLAAIKIIPKHSSTNMPDTKPLKKEAVLHQSIPPHPNIIHMYGYREDPDYMYIVMEYAGSGELFDRIAPDVGLEEKLAHFYFIQLVAGMEHMHANGVSHRDLKPENLLLDDDGNLKISDFGLATMFKSKGQRRSLTTACGTPPYVAPEIHSGRYEGDEVDVWSAGIILYTLLAGNTPWAEPTKHDVEFMFFCEQYPALDYRPWNAFPSGALHLLRGILSINRKQRFTIAQIKDHEWFGRPNDMLTDGRCNDPVALAESMMIALTQSGDISMKDLSPPMAFSQPEIFNPAPSMHMDVDCVSRRHALASFSQPAVGRMLVDEIQSQLSGLGGSLSQYKRQFKELLPTNRLTRFYTAADSVIFINQLSALLDEFLVPHKIHCQILSFSTVDKRKCPLLGTVEVQPVSSTLNLVIVRKSKGDPIEFKRFFGALRERLKPVIVDNPQPVEYSLNQYFN
ncbi:hypothetical protein SeMB42_g00490 [Synchytrium endobioticum]|uniref:non-specific serine/threonine protein kinase n=1 Tax=Synchytrium endobioticum TaxID=286115 RepID=A0A507DQS6_9FUNG|nr:hypothetical protein SeLEV6574_g00349 [Synchytrium endobioticum]TPX54069.1 hypothetical protein SeMB42_g00490 [Synchytrium endobioticum]